MSPALPQNAAVAYIEGAPYDMMRVRGLRDGDFTAYVFRIAYTRRNEHGVTSMHDYWTFVAAGVGMTPDGRFLHLVLSPEGAVIEGHRITLKDVDHLLRAAVADNRKSNERILTEAKRKLEGGGVHGRT
ncbi:MAG: hypothetical protein SGJ05_10945 [bacterium]|nr:hypothetical protein [bacterium]